MTLFRVPHNDKGDSVETVGHLHIHGPFPGCAKGKWALRSHENYL
jgi:hypothetical protein